MRPAHRTLSPRALSPRALSALALAATVGLCLSGCGYSGSHAAQVRSWASANSYLANAKQVVNDVRDIDRAVSEHAAKKMRTVCGGLSTDAGTLYGTLVTPDHELTNELSKSMEDFFDSAEVCAVAGSTTSGKVRRALSRQAAGIAELRLADRRIARFGVRSKKLAEMTRR